MSGPEIHPDGRGLPAGPAPDLRPSGKTLSSVIGVFAGVGRGARIGATLGTCGGFLVMMAYAVRDSLERGDGGMPLSARLIAWVFVAVWYLILSLVFCGVSGAVLGAMVGALFPARRKIP